MLALEEPRAISANNVLLTRVSAVGDQSRRCETRRCSVGTCGNTRFVARITPASCARLDLKPGKAVFAIVRSVTVDAAPASG